MEKDTELEVEGLKTPVSINASEIRDADGLFLGQMFILRDVTEVKRLQAEVMRNERLTQALLNLYLNAIQAMPNSGRLRVSAEARPDDKAAIVVEDIREFYFCNVLLQSSKQRWRISAYYKTGYRL